MKQPSDHRVVLIGGGFGGLHAAKRLGRTRMNVTLIDKRNFHLFQPLLYQVATGGLSPGDIASPLRAVLNKYRNITVLQGEAVDIDPQQQTVILRDGEVPYDTLVISTGASHHYFGNDHWEKMAPGLKTVEDALEMRQRIFLAFEAAERETDPQRQQAWMTFVVVGAGPTGVELAGALGELTRSTLRGDFHNIDPTKARIVLLEGLDRVLPPYPPELSHEARNQLIDRGVTVRTGTLVTDIKGDLLTLKSGDQQEQLYAHTVLWSAGVRASALGKVLERRIGAELDRAGRVKVAPDLSVPEHPNVFVIGDLAYYDHQDDKPLPGVATVAIQQGQFIAKLIDARLHGKPLPGFRYRDKGSLAVIGRNAAVADLGPLHFGGYIAWLIWVFVHIASLVEFDKRLIVMFQWSWSYLTRKRGARLITNVDPVVLLENREPVRTR